MFFAAGMYGMGLSIQHLGAAPATALLAGLGAGAAVAAVLALLALRTTGVAFLIVTLMFAQAGYLTILYFGEYTRGDEGFVIAQADRVIWGLDASDPVNRYLLAWALFAVASRSACGWSAAPSAGRWWRSARTRNGCACWATTPSRTSGARW